MHHKDRENQRNVGFYKTKHPSVIAGKNNRFELEPSKKQAVWNKYLKALSEEAGRNKEYSKVSKCDDLLILKDELITAIRDTKINKSPGEDQLIAENF